MGTAAIIAVLKLYRIHSQYRFTQENTEGSEFSTARGAKDEFINYMIQSGYTFTTSQNVDFIIYAGKVAGYMVTGETRLEITVPGI